MQPQASDIDEDPDPFLDIDPVDATWDLANDDTQFR